MWMLLFIVEIILLLRTLMEKLQKIDHKAHSSTQNTHLNSKISLPYHIKNRLIIKWFNYTFKMNTKILRIG